MIGLCGAELVRPDSVGASQGFLGWVAYLGAANAGIPLSYIVKNYGWGERGGGRESAAGGVGAPSGVMQLVRLVWAVGCGVCTQRVLPLECAATRPAGLQHPPLYYAAPPRFQARAAACHAPTCATPC